MAKFRTSRGLGDSKSSAHVGFNCLRACTVAAPSVIMIRSSQGASASTPSEMKARMMVVYDVDDRAAKGTVTAMVMFIPISSRTMPLGPEGVG